MNFIIPSFPLKPPRSSVYVSKLCGLIISSHFPPNYYPPPECLSPETDKNELLVIGKMVNSGLFRSPIASPHNVIRAFCRARKVYLAVRYLTRMEFSKNYSTVIKFFWKVRMVNTGMALCANLVKVRALPYLYLRLHVGPFRFRWSVDR